MQSLNALGDLGQRIRARLQTVNFFANGFLEPTVGSIEVNYMTSDWNYSGRSRLQGGVPPAACYLHTVASPSIINPIPSRVWEQ